MRVLLFVQTGDARPKCATRSVGFDPAEQLQGQLWLPGCDYYVWWTAHATALAADRWWLVECANADEGRVTIVMGDDGGPWGGRILASGGGKS